MHAISYEEHVVVRVVSVHAVVYAEHTALDNGNHDSYCLQTVGSLTVLKRMMQRCAKSFLA